LRLGACIGAKFRLSQLAAMSGVDLRQLLQDLAPASDLGLVRIRGTEVRFVHDPMVQAAYSLTSTEERERWHLTIGRMLLAKRKHERDPERLFEIVSHLNRGRRVIASLAERRQLIELNLGWRAGRTATQRAWHSTCSASWGWRSPSRWSAATWRERCCAPGGRSRATRGASWYGCRPRRMRRFSRCSSS
jgi:hypothetical protein